MPFIRKPPKWAPGIVAAGHNLRRGLVTYLPFSDGSGTIARDASGRNHHATLNSATWQSGLPGTIVNLSGSSQMMTIADAAELTLSTGLTILAVVAFTDLSVTNCVAQKYDATKREFQFARLSTGGLYGWVAQPDGTKYVGRYTADTTSILPVNTYHLLAMTWTGGFTSASVKLYIDGVQKDTTNFEGTPFTGMGDTTSPIKLGYYDATTTYAKEKYAMFALYNRALSRAEIDVFNRDWFVLSRQPEFDFWGGVFSGAPAAATSYTFTGPTSGTVNVASTNFTLTPNGVFTGTITPATDGTGSFTPSSLTWAGTSDAKTCTYTPTSTAVSPHTLSTSDDGGLTDPASIDYTVNAAPAVNAGVLSIASVASETVNLSTTAAADGTSPYNYQFHRGTTPDFTPGVGTAIGSNSTTRTYADTGRTNGTVYYYKCVVTDAAAETDTTNMIPAVPASTQGWLLLSDSFGDYTWNGSTTELNDFAMGRQLQAALNAVQTNHAIKHVVSNESTSGASAADFVGGLLATAISAAPAATYPYAVIMLGLNDTYDGNPKATYKSNMQSMVNTLQANSYTKVFLCYPPLVWWGTIETEAEQARLLEYCSAIDEIVAGETGCYAIGGLYGYTPNQTSDYGIAQNNIHLVEQGGAHTAMVLATGIYAALNPATGGGTPTFGGLVSRRV